MDKKFIKKFNLFVKRKLKTYNLVYLTCDFRGFFKKYYPINGDHFCDQLISCLLKNKLTVIIPGYSYTSSGKFCLDNTNTNLSYISKWAFRKKLYRTAHPIFSVFIIGKKKRIFSKLGKHAFGKKSVWEKLLENKSSLLHVGRPFNLGNTIIHFVENNVKAEYRFHKIFPTRVFKGKRYIGSNYSAFLQKRKFRGKKIDTDTKKISTMIEKKNFYKKIGSDKNFTNITHLDFCKTYNFMREAYNKNKKIFIKEVE